MKRDSPKRQEAKRTELIGKLEEVVDQMNHITPIEVCIKNVAEALIFMLEEKCRKKKNL